MATKTTITATARSTRTDPPESNLRLGPDQPRRRAAAYAPGMERRMKSADLADWRSRDGSWTYIMWPAS